MAADRQQLIDIIVKDRGLVRASLDNIAIETLEAEVEKIHRCKTGELTKAHIQQEARKQAAQIVAEEREQLRQTQAEVQAEAVWTSILLTFVGSKRVKPVQANRSIIESWLNPGEQMTAEWFKKIIADPTLAKQLLWDEYREVQDTPAQQKADRAVFDSVMKARGLSTHDVGFRLVRDALGRPGFTATQVEALIDSGKIVISQAKEQDHSNWKSQSLLTAYQSGDDTELAKLVKQAYFDQDPDVLATLKNILQDAGKKYRMTALRAVAQVEHEYYQRGVEGTNNTDSPVVKPVTETTASNLINNRPANQEFLDALKNRGSVATPVRVDTGVKELPKEITASVIKSAPPARLRELIQMYGTNQINNRLRAV